MIQVTVYDKSLQRVGWIKAKSATLTDRWLGQPSGSIVLPPSSRIIDRVMAGEKLNVVCEYRGEHFLSGALRNPSLSVRPGTPVTMQVRGHWHHLNKLAFVDPYGHVQAADLDDPAQAVITGEQTEGQVLNRSGYYAWPAEDSAEGLVKAILRDNLIGRLGMNGGGFVPVVIAPNLGRGPGVRSLLGTLPQVRLQTLGEAVLPLLQAAGLGLSIRHLPGTSVLTVDVWQPKTWARELTYENGGLRDGTVSLQDAELTRMLIGGPGELAARAFRQIADPALEAALGYPLEGMTEATSADMDWAELPAEVQQPIYYALQNVPDAGKEAFEAELRAAGVKALTKGAPSASMSLSLAETPTWKLWGESGFHTGDLVRLKVRGVPLVDRITEATVTLSEKGGITATPQVGDKKDDPTRQLMSLVAAIARRQGNTTRR